MKTGAIGTECKLRARWGDRPPVAGDVMRSESQRARLGYEILDVRRIEREIIDIVTVMSYSCDGSRSTLSARSLQADERVCIFGNGTSDRARAERRGMCMINYDTWVVGAWIDRSVETRRSVIEFRDRVIAAGNKKQASHTGIVHVFAKHMRNSMEHAVRTNSHVHEPDLAKAVLGSVDWYAIAEKYMEERKAKDDH